MDRPRRATPWRVWKLLRQELASVICGSRHWSLARWHEMLAMVAGLGRHPGRKGDGPPGAKTLWIGLQRMHDFVLDFEAQQIAARE